VERRGGPVRALPAEMRVLQPRMSEGVEHIPARQRLQRGMTVLQPRMSEGVEHVLLGAATLYLLGGATTSDFEMIKWVALEDQVSLVAQDRNNSRSACRWFANVLERAAIARCSWRNTSICRHNSSILCLPWSTFWDKGARQRHFPSEIEGNTHIVQSPRRIVVMHDSSVEVLDGGWSLRRDSNPGPLPYQGSALPPELRRHDF
jgi:hypothetical protein